MKGKSRALGKAAPIWQVKVLLQREDPFVVVK